MYRPFQHLGQALHTPRAAGLWTRGSGSVAAPAADKLFFLPQKPFMPLGTLRQQLLFPTGERSRESRVAFPGWEWTPLHDRVLPWWLGAFVLQTVKAQPWALGTCNPFARSWSSAGTTFSARSPSSCQTGDATTCGTGVNGWPDDELLARLDEVQLQGEHPFHRHLVQCQQVHRISVPRIAHDQCCPLTCMVQACVPRCLCFNSCMDLSSHLQMLLCRVMGVHAASVLGCMRPLSLIEAPAEQALRAPEALHSPDSPLRVPQAWRSAWAAWTRSLCGRTC